MNDDQDRAEWLEEGGRLVATNGIHLRVRVAGQGPTVVLVHGFPELGYSWRHQVPELVAAGYRVVVPDLRGYGGSDRPDAVESYDVGHLAADLVGVLDALDEPRATFVGHDWGASVVWYLAAAHPERVSGVVGLSVPIGPPAPAPPLSILRRRLGDDFYMVWFQEVGRADAVLAADPRRTLASVYSGALSDEPWVLPNDQAPDWLSAAEFDTYVDTFARTGFTGGLNFYRNIDRNWELWRDLDPIAAPALFLTGSLDPVAAFTPATGLDRACTDLRGVEVLEGAGHWLQQERPAEVTASLLGFLAQTH